MKIIVTGGCGFIGGTLIRKLLYKKDISIYNIDKYGYASDHDGIENLLKILYTLDKDSNTFIISHKGDIMFDRFTNIIKFEKYQNFTRIANV